MDPQGPDVYTHHEAPTRAYMLQLFLRPHLRSENVPALSDKFCKVKMLSIKLRVVTATSDMR